MLKRLIRTTWSLLLIAGLIGLLPAATAFAQDPGVACQQEYTVQTGDWLSSIAEETYGDSNVYPAIVQATNAQSDGDGFAAIDNPNVIVVGATLCLPGQSEVQSMMGQTGQMMAQSEQMAQSGQMEQTVLTAPSGQMLMVVRNQSKANATSTFTISGGEYGGGEQITVDAGEEVVLRLMPADYRVIWSSPAAEDISFGRSFTAVPGTVARARITPEKERVAFRFNVRQEEMAAEAAPETEPMTEMAQTQMDREFSFEPPAGRAMLVVGNRSKENIPSTLTITGGRFGGGEQISIDPGEEFFLPVEPGEFTVQWSSPIDKPGEDTGETVIVSRQVQLSAGEAPLWWIVPEEFRAFSQTAGEAPMELVP